MTESTRMSVTSQPTVSPCRPVVAVQWHSETIYELVLQREGLEFAPGDCVSITTASGVSRPYSIASGPTEDVLRFLIRRVPGGQVSGDLASARVGDAVTLSPPFGWFRPAREAGVRPYVYVATSTGVAPFLSALRSGLATPPAAILYGVRELADAVGLADLQAGAPTHLALSRETAPGHHHGRVTDLLDRLPITADTQVFLCGLDAMIESVSDSLEARGVDFTRIHREVFFHAKH